MTDTPGRGPQGTDEDEPVFVISVAARQLGIHPQTLRGYERQGLIRPARTTGGNRLYSSNDLARLRRIIELTEEGLTLTGVAKVLTLEDRLARIEQPSTALARRDQLQLLPWPRFSSQPLGDGGGTTAPGRRGRKPFGGNGGR